MIQARCDHCGKDLKVKDGLAGKKVKCTGCGNAVAVPKLAANLSPQPVSAPSPISLQDQRTLPPKLSLDQDSVSDTGALTNLGVGRPGEATQSLLPRGLSPELYDFLAPAEQPDEIGRLGSYRILKVLGAGGMGVVYKAEDPQLQRLVALKAMLPSLGASESARKRFLREARTAASIGHDHIVHIYQVGEDRSVPFMAMQFLEGEPLDERLKREERLPLKEVLRIGRETAEGLAAAHAKGLVHRDIKPANLWLEGQRGRIKILDFGLARAATDDTHLTQTGAIIGTPAYMAPEQAAGEAVDQRCDLFSLGCVLYRLCTGELPFKGNNTLSIISALAMTNPDPPSKVKDDVPGPLSELVMKLLAKKPAERPPSATAVVDAIQKIESQIEEPADRPGQKTQKMKVAEKTRTETFKTQPAGPAKKRPRWPLVAGLAAACGLVVAGIVLFWPTPHGLVKIESDDPAVEIVFDKTGPTIKGIDKEPIRLRAGEHGLLLRRGDFSFESNKLMIKKGETVTLKVELLPGKLQLVMDGKVIGSREIPLPTPPLAASSQAEQRAAAEWVLSKKGTVTIRLGGKDVVVSRPKAADGIEQLPKEPFTIVGVTLRRGSGPAEEISGNDVLRRLATLNDLETFWLVHQPKITTAGLGHLAGCSNMKDLILYGTGINQQAVPIIEKFSRLEKFQFPGRGSDALAEVLGKLPSLREVAAYRCDLSDAGIAHLAKAPKLEKLVLDETAPLTDRSLKALAVCRSLRFLQLDEQGVKAGRMTLAGAARLQKALTECKMTYGYGKAIPLPPSGPNPTGFKNALGMEFVLVPKGKSRPGLEITNDFYLGKYEVTQEDWEKVMGKNPSHFSRTGPGKGAVKDIADAELKRFPVETVSWADAQEFIKKLNETLKEKDWVYRLPRELEWEYACRGGPLANPAESAFNFYFDNPTNQITPALANVQNVIRRTCKVGSYKPNKLGLYDMHGNVSELCDGKNGKPQTRGGNSGDGPFDCGTTRIIGAGPSTKGQGIGLRLARVSAQGSSKSSAKTPGPVKVFILAGQSNMEGQAVVDLDGKDYNFGKGTLVYLMKDPAKAGQFKHLKDDKGQWRARGDVWVYYQPEGRVRMAGPLELGYTPYGDKHHFGPELQFGHVVGDHFANQVLLIKTCWGGKSLYKDFRPPSSGGQVGPYYTRMIAQVREALDNLKEDFPDYHDQGHELAGFVWYHGWNDGIDPTNAVPEYEKNLVNLIKDVRKDLQAPNLPAVIGEITGPWVKAPDAWATLRKAQAAAALRPEFKGNALFVETHDFVRQPEDSPHPNQGYHEYGNAETYFLVGDALGKGMLKLLRTDKLR